MYGPDLKSNQAKVGLQTLVTVTAGQREEESDLLLREPQTSTLHQLAPHSLNSVVDLIVPQSRIKCCILKVRGNLRQNGVVLHNC